jgi:hypothetical protein
MFSPFASLTVTSTTPDVLTKRSHPIVTVPFLSHTIFASEFIVKVVFGALGVK